MTPLLHITTEAAWQGARQEGVYQGDTLESDGFIHASLPHQVLAVAQRFYSEVPHLLLLVIDPARVVAEVRYEPGTYEGDDADQRFPHIYGPLNLDAVMTVVPLLRGADGAFVLPALPEIGGQRQTSCSLVWHGEDEGEPNSNPAIQDRPVVSRKPEKYRG